MITKRIFEIINCFLCIFIIIYYLKNEYHNLLFQSWFDLLIWLLYKIFKQNGYIIFKLLNEPSLFDLLCMKNIFVLEFIIAFSLFINHVGQHTWVFEN